MGKKVQNFEIHFANPKDVYQAGEEVKGFVEVVTQNELKLKGIRILLHGSAFVQWTERHTSGSGKNRRAVTKAFTAGETYFNQTQVLFGKAENQAGEDPVLQAGVYKYPFKFKLPPDLPASFESNLYGRVRYWAKAYIDRPWRFDKTTKKPFTVVGKLDFNSDVNAFQPQSGQAQKTLCCMCCESGPIAAIFKLEKTAYVPGEDLRPNGEVINHSNRTMASSKLEIQQIITFHAKTKSRRSTRTVAEIKQGEIRPGDTAIWTGEELVLPPVPPSGLAGCRIIDIDYKVKLVVDPAGPAFELQVPLTMLVVTSPPCQSRPPSAQNAQWNGRQGGHVRNWYKNVSPPLFAECVFGKVDIHDEDDNDFTMGVMKFAPCYVYYDFPDRGKVRSTSWDSYKT